jgi:membrane protease YdiL (CAAX protease family)
MVPQRKKLILEEDVSPSKNFLSLFNITKKNFKYQLLYGILLLFLIFIPLDFFGYLFLPEMLSYSSIVINPTGELSYNSYFMESYYVFLLSVIIIQISVAIYEETLVRGFLANRGSVYFHGIGLPIIFPIIWFLQTFLVGIILAMLVLRRRWIFPVIFAHAVNNIISAHSIWNFIHGNDFSLMSFIVYVPLLVISIFLFVWQFSRIKKSLSIGFKEFFSYFKNDNEIGENWFKKIVRIMMDFLFGLIIFTIGVIIL